MQWPRSHIPPPLPRELSLLVACELQMLNYSSGGHKEASWKQTLICQHDSPGPPTWSRGLHTNPSPQCCHCCHGELILSGNRQKQQGCFQNCREKCSDQREGTRERERGAKGVPLSKPPSEDSGCPSSLAARGHFLGPETIKFLLN